MLLWLLACAEPELQETAPATLDAPRLLRRASLDLRGVLPSSQELDAVEADPDSLEATILGWSEEPAFEERLVLMLGEQWHTRVEAFPIEAFDYGLDDEVPFERAVGEEPLRLAAYVVTQDLPWSQVVTAEHTMANALLLSIWDLEAEQEPGDGQWVPATYQDGRPHAGVLSTNGLWWKYDTDISNMNRRRVSAISRLLVCHDVLARPISLADASQDVEDAVRNDPACKTCHAALDPAAAALFGFWNVVEYSEVEHASYHPEREGLYRDYLGVEPAWYGVPVSGPEDLGRAIAADPRFDRCAVERFGELMLHRELSEQEQARFEADYDGYALHLIQTLLSSPEYADPTPRLMSPQLMSSAIAQATGYRWTTDGNDVMDIDEYGLRQLAGGVDGEQVKDPQARPGLTRTLVIKRLAELAGQEIGAYEGSLMIEAWYWRLLAEHPTQTQLDELETLHAAVLARDGQDAADAAVLTVILRDPAFEAY